jgi:hypothetical protein
MAARFKGGRVSDILRTELLSILLSIERGWKPAKTMIIQGLKVESFEDSGQEE